ncbi:flagella assembly protein FlgT middle domain-containing protein [Methylomonas sp. MgM2]
MRCKNWPLILLMLLTMSCSEVDDKQTAAVPVNSRQATVHGSAPITGAGVERARQAAVDDAVAKAALQLRQSRAQSLLSSDIKIVDEWQESGAYHVQVLVLLAPQHSCQSSYRKRIVATAFPAMNTEQISGSDSQDLYNGIPREISNQLMETGDFIVSNLTNTSLYYQPDLAPNVPWFGRRSDSVVLTIADRYNAQLVLAGVIRDFKIESTEYVRGSGILAMVKSTMRDYVARRSIGIDVYVYDGFTGALLFQQRYTDSVTGDVSVPPGYTVGSERFESSPVGHSVNGIVQQAGHDIQQLFACYPFAARVDYLDNGRIVIKAGAQDGVKVGDRLMLYSAGDTDRSGLGFTNPIGVMVTTDVGPTMASGQLEDGLAQTIVRPGDWVRSVGNQ